MTFSPHTRGLVRILRAIVESLMLAVLKVQSHIFVRCRVALELIGDQSPRRDAALSEELSHQPLGRMRAASALHQDVQHDAKLIHRSPQPMLLAFASDEHFIQMPFVAKG